MSLGYRKALVSDDLDYPTKSDTTEHLTEQLQEWDSYSKSLVFNRKVLELFTSSYQIWFDYSLNNELTSVQREWKKELKTKKPNLMKAISRLYLRKYCICFIMSVVQVIEKYPLVCSVYLTDKKLKGSLKCRVATIFDLFFGLFQWKMWPDTSNIFRPSHCSINGFRFSNKRTMLILWSKMGDANENIRLWAYL